jgi:hypothetical protein
MEVVTDREKGLFPSPKEIQTECSCPDWATMCKHAAAVLYGVGARLDDSPELLFVLRGVETAELIGAHAEAALQSVVRGGKGRRIAEKDPGSIFGMDIDLGTESAPGPKRRGRRTPKPDSPAVSPFPAVLQSADIRAPRKRLDLTAAEFALLLGVSAAAVSVWERSRGPLRLQMRTRAAVENGWTRGRR